MSAATVPQFETNARILIVDDDDLVRQVLTVALHHAGYEVDATTNGEEALAHLRMNQPHLIISDMMMPIMNGLELLKSIRLDTENRHIPFILLTARESDADIVMGLDLGADDYLIKPVDPPVLLARVRAKLRRPPVPIDEIVRNYNAQTFTFDAFMHETQRELARVQTWKSSGYLAAIGFHEMVSLRSQLPNIFEPITRQVTTLAHFDGTSIELIGIDNDEHVLILMPEVNFEQANVRLEKLAKRIANHDFLARGEHIRLTPIIGFVALKGEKSAQDYYEHAIDALAHSEMQLDNLPKFYTPATAHRPKATKPKNSTVILPGIAFILKNWRTGFQILMTFVLGWGIPFFIYAFVGSLGFDLAQLVYILVVISLLLTSVLIWTEGYLALKRENLPEFNAPCPPASVLIPAYLPNEAATIQSTLEACFELKYPGPLQIILAYNTPTPLPIEEHLHALAEQHPSLTIFKVEQSTSKAQNVNAALSLVTGEFVGIFDADHHPQPDSLCRAWAWLSNGYDVVQGHCLIRNGHVSRISKLIAVEFEAIYAVSHPGRARLHDFGIFGGSNGYWRTTLLNQIRMQGFMLTEDIDSSMRTLREGYKIKSDRDIISRELAPTSLSALWTQRMRWAQGWYQVTRRHTLSGLLSSNLTLRQKLGFFQLLIWREIYPWIAMQIIPIIAYWIWSKGSIEAIDWFVPIFVITTLVTLGTGPGQILFILKVGHESITRRWKWILFYLATGIFYTEYKNLIGRVAQMKEFMGERKWHTTPRG